ncbi:hypothetical protein NDU88_007377 [Pleurodeles waltl]|uniref:Uncharacterized protein n=1 Tax=Pleurodeles waltl TaxID=8319 RepID=A0AAV7WHH3_PLEWA|nr:hypothetical protein NDU88_007377 [Pleurodeles waltl]
MMSHCIYYEELAADVTYGERGSGTAYGKPGCIQGGCDLEADADLRKPGRRQGLGIPGCADPVDLAGDRVLRRGGS